MSAMADSMELNHCVIDRRQYSGREGECQPQNAHPMNFARCPAHFFLYKVCLFRKSTTSRIYERAGAERPVWPFLGSRRHLARAGSASSCYQCTPPLPSVTSSLSRTNAPRKPHALYVVNLSL